MVINTVSGNFLSSATDDGTETVAEASVLTPELEARVQQVSPTEESTVAAQEEEEANARVESVNNNEGENVDSTDPEPGNESNNESTEKEALGEFAPLVDLTKDFLLKNNLIDTAEASSSGIITGSITFGSSGKYTLLKDSGAATYKQYDSRWASKKYGLKKNSRGTNVCSTFKEAACAPSAIANAVSKYVNKTPESVGNRIKDRYPSYRNNYTSGSPCKSGTKSDAIADVGSDYLTSSNYVIKTAKLGWSDAKRAIDSNYPVIFKTTNSNFTSGGHYLVIRGKIKRKSDGKIFYWLSDSGPRNIKAATEAEITRGNGGYWKTYRSSARVVSNFETLYI